jgi:hypothetical protein
MGEIFFVCFLSIAQKFVVTKNVQSQKIAQAQKEIKSRMYPPSLP